MPAKQPIEANSHSQNDNENDRWQRLLLVLLFLLLGFSCVFCSAQTALWVINRDWINAPIRSAQQADYEGGPSELALAPLREEIALEATQDALDLARRQTPVAQGVPVAVLPILQPTLTPTPTPTPTSPPVPVSPKGPTPPLRPSPTPVPPTSTAAPPPTPTFAPPTSTPVASPTPASPTPTAPPTATPIPTPIATDTPVPTLPPTPTAISTATPTSTNTPTATPTATFTPTSTPAPPQVVFAAALFSENESTGQATITTTLTLPSALTVTVAVTSSDVTATAGSDYTPVNRVLTFPPAQTQAVFTVPITNDTITNEFTESLLLTLITPTNAVLGSPNPATLNIVDDDGQPTVSFAATDFAVFEDDSLGVIGVELSAASALTITVSYATQDGTATAPADYTPASGSLTFPPGQVGLTFDVPVIDDTDVETGNETVQLQLSNAVSATLGATAAATLTIVDNDPISDTTCIISSNLTEVLPNIGPPNGQVAGVLCGTEMIVPLTPTTTVVADNDPEWDMVYYELLQSAPDPQGICPSDYIFLDWVVVQVGQSATGPWYTVFSWGDNVADTNTNVAAYSAGGEWNNEIICATDLYTNTSGIAIDVDARAPAGVYSYVRLYVPAGPNPYPNPYPPPPIEPLDGLEVDALDSIP